MKVREKLLLPLRTRKNWRKWPGSRGASKGRIIP